MRLDKVDTGGHSVIAVADADAGDRARVACLLREDGHEVDEFRDFEQFREADRRLRHDLAVIDASFISLALVLPPTLNLLTPQGEVIALIKPQFEVGRAEATRSAGVIRDQAVRRAAIDGVLAEVVAAGAPQGAVGACGGGSDCPHALHHVHTCALSFHSLHS